MRLKFPKIFGKVFRSRDPSDNTVNSSIGHIPDFLFKTEVSAAYKNYALQLCINKLADALSLCEFQTFKDGKQIEEINWYRFNVEPNRNQNQNEFWNKVLYKMVYCVDGALVIQSREGEFIIADDFEVREYAYLDNVYSDIVLPGNYRMESSLLESQVMHFKLHNSRILEVVDSIYDDYGKLISGTIRNYNRGNAIKLKLSIDAIFEQFKNIKKIDENGKETTQYDAILEDLFKNKFAPIFEDKDSITPMQKGLDLSSIDESSKGNTKSGSYTTRDITDTFDDIVNMVADAFGIPRGLIKGDVADNEGMMKMFTTFPVRSLVDNINQEINRKLYGQKLMSRGSKLKIQTNMIRTYDIVEVANSAEALFRIGAMNTDEIRVKLLNEEPLNTEISQRYAITKNYELEGGNQVDGQQIEEGTD